MSIIPPISALPAMPAMPAMPTSALGAMNGMAPASSDGGLATPDATRQGGAVDFAGALSSAISGLNTQMNQAERLSEAVASGQVADPTSALVEVEKADLAFNTAMQVRNKLVEGWQEVSRMTV